MGKVLIAVSGGIAAYRVGDVVSGLQHDGHDVQVIMTKNACEFVTPGTFEALTGKDVFTDVFAPDKDASITHVTLAEAADVFAVVPATANVVAKLACGIADDMVTSTWLAATCPKVVFPSMHMHMYANPAVQHNLDVLRSRGVDVVEPAVGRLASGEEGRGVLPPVADVVAAIEAHLNC